MNNDSLILKAARAAVSGTPTVFSATDYESAMLRHAALQKLGDETDEQAFARCIREREPTVELLAKAMGATLNTHAVQKDHGAKARLVTATNDALDTYIAKNQRNGEDEAATTARLYRENDPGLSEIANHLRDINRSI